MDRTRRSQFPPLAVLQSFLDVVETGSVTRTAERLSLTQSAVSHHVAQFERFMGTRVFERGDRAMRATAEAVALAARLRADLAALARTLDGARSDNRTLWVAVAPELLTHWLHARLSRFASLHPRIALEIRADPRRDVLATGPFELQLRLGRPGVGETGFVLSRDEEVVVCAPALAASLPPREAFAAAPFLTEAAPSPTRLDWVRWLAELYGSDHAWSCERHPRGYQAFAAFDEVLDACRRGEGFALVRRLLVRDDLAAGRLVVAVEEQLEAELDYGVIHRREPAPSPAAQHFMDWLREAAADGAQTAR